MTSFRYNGGQVANWDGAANTSGHPLPCSFRQGVSRSPRRRGVFSLGERLAPTRTGGGPLVFAHLPPVAFSGVRDI